MFVYNLLKECSENRKMSLYVIVDIFEDYNFYGNFFGGCKSWWMVYFNVLLWYDFCFVNKEFYDVCCKLVYWI